MVSLQGNGQFEITQTKYRLTEEQKQEDGEKLFDFCAECLKTFVLTNMDSIVEHGADEEAVKEDGVAVAAATTMSSVSDSGVAGSLIKPGQELALGFTVCTFTCMAARHAAEYATM